MENSNSTNQPGSSDHPKKTPFYQSTWFIILMLVFFFPIGVFLMWKYKRFNKIVRAVLTVFFLWVLISTVSGRSNGSSSTADSKKAKETVVEITTAEETTTVAETTTVTEATTVETTSAEETIPETEASVNAKSETAELSMGQKNALSMAADYLNYSAFSYSGLIEQLKYEQFSEEDATYAADNCGADWNEQAAIMAQQYLDYSSFSRGSLIDQLKYEGFTQEQAEHGAAAVGY